MKNAIIVLVIAVVAYLVFFRKKAIQPNINKDFKAPEPDTVTETQEQRNTGFVPPYVFKPEYLILAPTISNG